MEVNNSQYINQKFNNATVLGFTNPPDSSMDKQKKYRKWVTCKCDCGNIFVTHLSALKNNVTKSCGCQHHRSGKKSPYFQGLEEISGKFFTHIRRTAMGGTNKRKRVCKEFNLSIEFLWNLYIKQNRKCALSGLEIKFHSNHKWEDGTASLDRIDSSKGYIEDNVQWVHKKINIMKNKFDEKEFIDLCCLVSKTKRVHSPE